MIKKAHRYIFGFVVASIGMLALAADGPPLKEIMQGLRSDTNAIAEGLFIDDFDQVASAAGNIANHPQIPPDQVQLVAAELAAEMPAFKQFDTLVHDLSLSIAAAAQNSNRDQAITDFHRMLDGCFACHAAYKDRVSAVLSGAKKSD